MKEFKLFLEKQTGFEPISPSGALKAFEAGILPITRFIYMGTSIHPIDEKTFNMAQLEQVLNIKNVNIHAKMFVVSVLEKLLKHKDAEIALFAAESLNQLEAEYNTNIEETKEELDRTQDPVLYIRLARLYYEFALINESTNAVKTFYLKEAVAYLKKITRIKKIMRRELKMLIDILLIFKQYTTALNILENIKHKHDPFFLLLRAEIEYHRKNFTSVFTILEKIKNSDVQMDDRTKNILSYWMEMPWQKRSESV